MLFHGDECQQRRRSEFSANNSKMKLYLRYRGIIYERMARGRERLRGDDKTLLLSFSVDVDVVRVVGKRD